MEGRRIIVTGSSGLLGSNLLNFLRNGKGVELYAVYHSRNPAFPFCRNVHADITKSEDAARLLELQPDIIIHCAALTKTNYCEENREQAYNVNVLGTKNIAETAKKSGSRLAYISTDAVFDGTKGNYNENDEPRPLNIYGATKLEGEKCCREAVKDALIIRTNIFGNNLSLPGLSFAESILKSLREKKTYNAFSDAMFSPLYVGTFCDYLIQLCDSGASGTYHVHGSQSLSKYEFALKLADIFGYDSACIRKSTIETVSGNIRRPKNLSMDNSKLMSALKIGRTPTAGEMIAKFKADCDNLAVG
ncbi:SDR family oxidoreductase [Candidatus Woesearchaeota archaeon]|nr:SDR family oxidoreductase [Candidatus Woesearchaeota archaeon]